MLRFSTRLGFILASALAVSVIAGGLAHADAQPGSADSTNTSTVNTPSSNDGSVKVSNQTTSTTTVGQTSDGQTTTPAITQTNSGSGTNPPSNSGQVSPSTNQTTTPTGPTRTSKPAAVTKTTSTTPAAPIQNNTWTGPIVPVVNHAAPVAASAPVAPTPDNKNTPTPLGTNGQIAPSSVTLFGSLGRGIAGKTAKLSQTFALSLELAGLAYLALVAGSFLAYLRRSRFRHAPRSDASALFSFDISPALKTQARPYLAAPVFLLATDRNLTNRKEVNGIW